MLHNKNLAKNKLFSKIEVSVRTKKRIDQTMEKSPFNLEDIKLIESNLSEYAMALRSAEGDSTKEISIRKFFEYKPYTSSSHSGISSYSHNKLQWVHNKFWKEISGFEIIKETNYGWTDEIPPKKMDMEIELNKNILVYKNVTIFYSKGDKKVIVSISKSEHNGSYDYEVFFQNDGQYFSDWDKLADAENFYKGKKIDAGCRFLDLKGNSWDDVILVNDKKKVIQDNIDGLFKNRDKYKEFGIPVKRGIILHGPPGTGKTQAVKALANTSEGYSVLYVMPRDFDPQKGGVSRIAKMAQDLAPCLLIIEDIDFIAKDRELGNAGAVIELMNYLDGLEEFGDIVTFGTTNHIKTLEDAVKNRPGRFDRLIEIGMPEKEERIAMIKAFTKKFDISSIDMDSLSENLSEFVASLSGAHIKDICNTAAAFAVRSGSIVNDNGKNILVLKIEHFREALSEVGNKDYSSYAEMQSKTGGMGFGARRGKSLFDFCDDSDQNDDF